MQGRSSTHDINRQLYNSAETEDRQLNNLAETEEPGSLYKAWRFIKDNFTGDYYGGPRGCLAGSARLGILCLAAPFIAIANINAQNDERNKEKNQDEMSLSR